MTVKQLSYCAIAQLKIQNPFTRKLQFGGLRTPDWVRNLLFIACVFCLKGHSSVLDFFCISHSRLLGKYQ